MVPLAKEAAAAVSEAAEAAAAMTAEGSPDLARVKSTAQSIEKRLVTAATSFTHTRALPIISLGAAAGAAAAVLSALQAQAEAQPAGLGPLKMALLFTPALLLGAALPASRSRLKALQLRSALGLVRSISQPPPMRHLFLTAASVLPGVRAARKAMEELQGTVAEMVKESSAVEALQQDSEMLENSAWGLAPGITLSFTLAVLAGGCLGLQALLSAAGKLP